MLISQRGKRLGDFAAGTYVIRDRVTLRLPLPPPMPPQLANWARTADLASLPTGLALGIRQYLGRFPTLDPQSRQRVGDDLVTEVRRYVAPAPPAGAPPRWCSGPSSRSAASATWPGCGATRSSARGSRPGTERGRFADDDQHPDRSAEHAAHRR